MVLDLFVYVVKKVGAIFVGILLNYWLENYVRAWTCNSSKEGPEQWAVLLLYRVLQAKSGVWTS